MDVYTIPPGEDFKVFITSYLQQCAVQLVIIGQHWLKIADQYGRRRIDDPADTLRLEIETALELGVFVIPILVDGAKMPDKEGLPDSLKILARLNALPVRIDPDFGHDMERVSRAVEARLERSMPEPVGDTQIRDSDHSQCRCCDNRSRTPVQADNAEPSEARQAELIAASAANVQGKKAPYADISVRTAGELRWILARQNWSGNLTSRQSERPNLAGVDLSGVDLGTVDLNEANLQGATLGRANLVGAALAGASLTSANFGQARLNGADLGQADLTGANLSGADLRNANLSGARLTRADLSDADLRGMLGARAGLESAILTRARMDRAVLRQANLKNGILIACHFEEADLSEADLSGADLRQSHFDTAANLSDIRLNTGTRVADVMWNGVALARIDWSRVRRLGDETQARSARVGDGRRKGREERLMEYGAAARAYRGLAVALRTQGLGVRASDFRLQEQRMERQSLLLEGRFGAWFFSLLLAVTSGYGERPARLLTTYVTIVFTFALLFYSLSYIAGFSAAGFSAPNLTAYEALILSITSFHGRGLIPGNIAIGDPVSIIAAIEAVVGLFIELMFIAVFTRRFISS
jgi:uncharacterized protein YjbI with pentapeptide repeats